MSTAPLLRPEIQRRQGWAPLPNECLWDWARLVSGDAQIFSILFINSEIHTLRRKGTPAPKWSRPISNEEFAQFARCTVRAIEIALGDLLKRKVIERKKSGKGFIYSIPFGSWPELPDRPSKIVVIGEAEQAEEEGEDEANKRRGEIMAVFGKPQRVRAGGRTRPKVLPAAAGKLQFEGESEMEFDARMCDGVLTIRAKGEIQAKSTGTKGDGKRNELRSNNTQLQSNQQNDFHKFETAYCQAGVTFPPSYWDEARSTWNILELSEKLAAVKGVRERFEQREYPEFIPNPQKYLRKKLWMGIIRPPKSSKKAPATEPSRYRYVTKEDLGIK